MRSTTDTEDILAGLADGGRNGARMLRDVIDASQAAIYVKDTNGRFLLVNRAAAAAIGRSPAQVVGLKDEDLLPPQEAERITEHDREIVGTGRRDEYEESIVTDGQTRTYVSVKFPVRDREGRIYGVAGISTDITDRKRAEQQREMLLHEMQRQRTLLQDVLDAELAGIALLRVPDLRFEMVNERLRELSRGRAQVGVSVLEAWPDSAEYTRAFAAEVIETGETRTEVDVPFTKRSDGEQRYFTISLSRLTLPDGSPGLLGTVYDSTSRVQALEEISRLAEEAQRRAAELDAVFEAASDPIVVYDRNGQASRANKAALELLGLDPTSLMRGDLGRVLRLRALDGTPLPEQDYPSARAQHGEAVLGRLMMFTNARGQELIVTASAAPLRSDGEIDGAVTIWHDVTEEQRLADELHESTSRLTSILEDIADSFVAFDLDWRFTYVNQHAEELLRTSRHDILGRTLWEAFPEVAGTESEHQLHRALQEKRPQRYETYYEPLGMWLEVRVHPAEDGLVVFFSDITARRRQEQELREARERASMLARYLDDSAQAFGVSTPDARLIMVNPAFAELTGYSEQELLSGMTWRCDLTAPESQGTEAEYIEDMISTGRPQRYQKWYARKDGTRVPVEVFAHVMFDEAGNPSQFYAFVTDITERQRAEEAHERLVSELQQARLKAESAAEEARGRAGQLDSVFASLADGVFIYDSHGRIVKLNDQARRLLGYSDDDLQRPMSERLGHFTITDEQGRIIMPPEFPSQRALEGETIRNRVLKHESPDRPTLWLAWSSAPILDDDDIVGAVTTVLDITSEHELIEGQAALVRALGDANADLTAISRVTEVAVVSLDLGELLDSLLQRLVQVTGADTARVLLSEDGVLRLAASWGVADDGRKGWEIRFGEGFAGWIAANQTYRYVADAQENPLVLDPVIKEHGIRSILGVPLVVGSEVIGVLHIDWFTVHPESAREVNLLELSADRIALAIRNAQLYEERRRAGELSAALNEIDTAIGSTLEFDEIMRRVVARAGEAVGAEAAMMFVHDDEGWRSRFGWNVPAQDLGRWYTKQEAFYSTLATTRPGRVLADNHIRNHPDYDQLYAGQIRATGILDAALVLGDQVVGDLALFHLSEGKTFSPEHVDFVRKAAISVSLALQNARQFAEERDVADTLQRSLLAVPKSIEGLEFECLYRSAAVAATVGGDFYDLFEMEDRRVGIVVGDVSGKGLAASTLTSLVRNTIRAYAYDVDDPAITVAKTNRVVTRLTASNMFVTLFVAILDTRTGEMAYCNAGHPEALLIHPGERWDPLPSTAPLVGAFEGLPFANGYTHLSEGDLLLLYTDGFIEARKGSEMFGEERLVRTAMDAWEGGSPQGLPQRVWGAVERFTGGTTSDDAAMLAVSLSRR